MNYRIDEDTIFEKLCVNCLNYQPESIGGYCPLRGDSVAPLGTCDEVISIQVYPEDREDSEPMAVKGEPLSDDEFERLVNISAADFIEISEDILNADSDPTT